VPQSSFLRLFRSRWRKIARCFWPETPRQLLESTLARLDTELAQRQSRLFIIRKRIEKLYNLLNRHERRLDLLAAGMHEAPADAGAVADLERLRERLQKCEHGYALRLARLRQRRQDRAELRERLLSGRLRKQVDEENDPDYPF
jgi:uncharacterized membrane protein YccC